jgi:hypothetical protein
VFSGFGGATGGYYFGNSCGKYLTYDGTNFNLVGGPLCAGATASGLVSGDICSARSSTSGYYFFGSSSKSLSYDVSVGYFTFTGGPLQLGTGFSGRTGIGGTYAASPYTHNFQWNGSLIAWVDSTAVGTITLASDYRIKKDVIDLPGMWDTVKALRPIKYTQAQFSPPSHVNYIAAEVLKARMEVEENPEAKPREVNVGPLYPADDIERWGFIAHELQATLVPSAATGEKDSPDTIQSPNPFTIIAALTKALQEAMTRIEALEQKVAPVGQPVTR